MPAGCRRYYRSIVQAFRGHYASEFGPEEEALEGFDHLCAFNFGCSVGRAENTHDGYWLRVG
jgi:hypothetical protein